jgi:hypothetical protein
MLFEHHTEVFHDGLESAVFLQSGIREKDDALEKMIDA